MKSLGMNPISSAAINQLTNNQGINKTSNSLQSNLAGIAKKATSPIGSFNQYSHISYIRNLRHR